MARNRTDVCSHKLLDRFGVSIDRKMWRVNGLMLFNAILMGVVVAIAAYAPRYRRHPVFRFLFLGASTLFLPIVSEVASTLGGDHQYFSGILSGKQVVAAKCQPGIHVVLVLLWTGLVVLIGINTSAVVAGDAREGRNIEPPTELFIKAIWTAYLIYTSITKKGFLTTTRYLRRMLRSGSLGQQVHIMFVLLTSLTLLKLLYKYYKYHMAQRSLALGRSPRFIVGYMAKLQLSDEIQGAHQQHIPPALIVQGEETGKVQKRHSGYFFEGTPNPDQLVTLDKVWNLDDDTLPGPKPKDLCFSFALFKLLRCRFAKYTVSEAGYDKARTFFKAILLRVNTNDYEKVFRVVADELSFIHDYYYSTPPSNVIFPLMSIGCCGYMLAFIFRAWRYLGGYEQIYCLVWCPGKISRRQTTERSLYSIGRGDNTYGTYLDFGNTNYDVLPVILVITVLVFSEIRDIFSGIGSKWSKVALICKYAKRPTTCLQKRIAFVFRFCRFKLVKSWEGKMNQCSILVPRAWKISLVLRYLLCLPNQKKTKVPGQVKKAIFKAIQQHLANEQEGDLKHVRPPQPPARLPGNAFSLRSGTGAADTILAWHIATSIYEVRHPHPQHESSPDDKLASIHLSCYCAYLVGYLPGLLPDDDEWCKSLYQDVKKDADRVLAGRSGSAASALVELLSADSNHDVVKNGARLGEQLVDLETCQWGKLARFWSEMLMYVAPSENLDAHAEAIACGGELITLLWVLLEHAGIVGRQGGSATPA